MQFGPWAFLLIAGVTTGAAACAAMVVPRRLMTVAGTAGAALMVTTAVAVVRIWQSTQRPDALIAALFLALGAAIGGFGLASSQIPAVTHARAPVPTLPPTPSGDRIAVVLLADTEPEDYTPSAITDVFERYDLSDVPLPPDAARPIVYASERSSYHRLGGSPARGSVRSTASALAARLRDETPTEIFVAYCGGRPSLAEAVVRGVESGASNIVVAPLAVAGTALFDSAVNRASALGLSGAGIDLEVAGPLWASEHLSAMVAQRVLAALGGDRRSDGVVLVSRGEPQQYERGHPETAEQTTYFSQRVRAELVEAGLAPERIRRAWLEWEEPDVSEAVRHLAAVGATRIVIAPVDFPVDTIATLVDLRFVAERAADETGASVIVLSAWGDDPSVVQALSESVAAARARLG